MSLQNHDNKDIDVLLVYQERDLVEQSIKHIQELDVKLRTLTFEQDNIKLIVELIPKVILLSANSVVSAIKFYIELLENHYDGIFSHKVILLISNKETTRAYLACESGLFDNYVVINPLNDPHRLKLVIKNILCAANADENQKLKELIKSEEEELIACIRHGQTLKRSINENLLLCEKQIIEGSELTDDAQLILKNIAEITFQTLNQKLSSEIQPVLDRMDNVKAIQSLITSRLEKHLDLLGNKSPMISEAKKSSLTSSIEEPESEMPIYKLLIAEDSELFVQVITEIFDTAQFQYVVSNDGLSTLLKVKEFEPDVILLGYDLPNMNGIEVTKKIRADQNNVPIIAFTHHNDKKLIRQWITLGLSGYLIKPSTQKNIFDEVMKAVENPVEILTIKSDCNHNLEWLPEYSVGNELLDEQHKVLFEIINDFFHNTSKKNVTKIFHQLSDYISEHFKTEESLLVEMAYPKVEQHKKKHALLIKKFLEIQQNILRYTPEEHNKIALFLYNWLSKHILSEDMDYKEFSLKLNNPSNKVPNN